MGATDRWCELQPAFTDDAQAAAFATQIPEFTTSPYVTALRAGIDDYLRAPDDWRGTGSDPRPVVATWLTDWAALFDRSAQVLAQPVGIPG
jgi:hypothetical protein